MTDISEHKEHDADVTMEWYVSQCQCGQMVLECGAVSLRMTRLDFARLHRIAQAAMERFGIAPSEAAVASTRDVQLH